MGYAVLAYDGEDDGAPARRWRRATGTWRS